MFILLARDPLAADLVQLWASQRSRITNDHYRDPGSDVEIVGREFDKILEALRCAEAMRQWHLSHVGKSAEES